MRPGRVVLEDTPILPEAWMSSSVCSRGHAVTIALRRASSMSTGQWSSGGRDVEPSGWGAIGAGLWCPRAWGRLPSRATTGCFRRPPRWPSSALRGPALIRARPTVAMALGRTLGGR
ncbi:hypothetical protein B0H17DRAFT_1081423 [Mycena rosella]|uniref:Uncharacterized protein n=1 Tax=Mycena rosella TaxID=1033263 RepID=A0AAD7G7I1_MYCRO|nr:hypothetical protein B0H17DRAFT_1081423 [Mycena rosella]